VETTFTYAAASSNRSSRSKPHGSSMFKPSGSSKFNVQEFKVILRPVPVPAVSNVPLLRSVPNRSRRYRFSASRRAARRAPHGCVLLR